MIDRVVIDAGSICLFFQKDPPKEIEKLMQSIKEANLSAFVPSMILVEVYKHLCIAKGKDYAANCTQSFRLNFKFQLVTLTPNLIIDAGYLKCQYRTKLSYNDNIVIATALKMKAPRYIQPKKTYQNQKFANSQIWFLIKRIYNVITLDICHGFLLFITAVL